MRSRSFNAQVESYEADDNTLSERSESIRNQYARGRSAKAPKRRTSRTSSVPLGISGRRNRRFTW
jgi:hypothetical protein